APSQFPLFFSQPSCPLPVIFFPCQLIHPMKDGTHPLIIRKEQFLISFVCLLDTSRFSVNLCLHSLPFWILYGKILQIRFCFFIFSFSSVISHQSTGSPHTHTFL